MTSPPTTTGNNSTQVSLDLFEALNVLVVVVDAQLVIRQATGYSRRLLANNGELLGTPLQYFVAPNDTLKLQALRNCETVTRLRLIDSDGKVRLIEFHSQRVGPAEHAFLLVGADLTELEALQSSFAILDDKDPLTGLGNHAHFQKCLKLQIENSLRNQTQFCVAVLGLDSFKSINESRGHLIGDELLQAVARRLRCTSGVSDTLVRVGGDEFAVIMPEASCELSAIRVARYMAQALEQPYHVPSGVITLSACLGIARWHTPDTTAQDLFTNAEVALAQAKAQGSNQVVLFRETARALQPPQSQMGELIRAAITAKEFRLAYQPVVDPLARQIRGVEALMRLNARGTEISPAEFIPAAEENGHIHHLGAWALRTACEQIAAWDSEGLNIPYVAVNVSPIQLAHPDFMRIVESILREYQLPPSRLVLEITEGLLMQNTQQTQSKLEKLRTLGIGLSLDDFGTGYSSLSYLNRFPVSTIKIDRSFVSDMLNSSQGLTLVKAILNLARDLGLHVIAEGVETQAQADILVELGCPGIQGWLYSKAVSGTSLQQVLLDAKIGHDRGMPQKML